MIQHVHHHHDVDCRVRQRQRLTVGRDQRRWVRHAGEHADREVDTEDPGARASQRTEVAPGTTADVGDQAPVERSKDVEGLGLKVDVRLLEVEEAGRASKPDGSAYATSRR